MSDENTQTFQVEVVILIKHQILITNLQGNVWQFEERIYNQILGVKGVSSFMYLKGEVTCQSLLGVTGSTV